MTTIQHPVYTVSYNGILYRILRRTFEAIKYPKDSVERKELNIDSYTSEYMPSYKYELRWYTPATSKRIAQTHKRQYRTRREAVDDIQNQIKWTESL